MENSSEFRKKKVSNVARLIQWNNTVRIEKEKDGVENEWFPRLTASSVRKAIEISGGETMRPQTRWRAIRVSVFGRRPMREGRDVTRPKPSGNPSGRIPDLYVPVISLAIEIPWATSCVRGRFRPVSPRFRIFEYLARFSARFSRPC